MNTDKLKKIINIVAICGTFLIVSLIIIMIVLFAVRGNLAAREARLQAEIEQAEQQIENLEDEIEYRKSADYIEKYWLQYGYITDDSTKFVPKY